MSDKTKQAGAADDANKKLSRNELLEKLRTLQERVQSTETDKKNAASTYGEELKDLRGEIKDVLRTLKDTPVTA